MNNQKNLIEENIALLNRLPPLTGDMARLAHRLSVTSNRLDVLLCAAKGQLLSGKKEVTFTKAEIDAIDAGLFS